MPLPFGQTIDAIDALSVASLVGLEAMLSADNAVVLAMLVRHLPKEEQKRALSYGLSLALAFRFIAILGASLILQFWWLQAIGALYLLFLTVKHFLAHASDGPVKPVTTPFWGSVAVVGVTDLAFAIDSVLAGITFINNHREKLWVVYVGALMGIVLLRFATRVFTKLLEHYPQLDHVAYAVVGWVAIKLAFLSAESFQVSTPGVLPIDVAPIPEVAFYGVLIAIAAIGGFIATRHAEKSPSSDE
jgi:YkoY family integral membrane protein